MKSKQFFTALSESQVFEILKGAKGGSWYDDNWKPYCLMCSTIERMGKRDYGFECMCCKNMIGFDLKRLIESPLNKS